MSQLDCKWKLECFFSVLDLGKCKEIGKIGEILFGASRTDKRFRENDFKRVVRNSEIFPRKCRYFFGGPRTETKLTCQVVRDSEKVENRCFRANKNCSLTNDDQLSGVLSKGSIDFYEVHARS